MSISSILNTATSGMTAQTDRLGAVADNLANSATPGYDRRVTNLSSLSPSGGVRATVSPSSSPVTADDSNVDPTMEITNMLEAEAGFAANAAAFETGADLWQVLASIKRD